MLPSLAPVLNKNQVRKELAAPESKTGFYLVLVYLLFEFGRPHELLGLMAIPFGTGLSILILFKLLTSGRMSMSRFRPQLWFPLFGIMAIHVPIAVNNFAAFMTLKDMLLLYFVSLGIVAFINSLERMMSLIKVWLGIHLFLAIMGVVHGGVGIGGWMEDENDFCMVMNMVVPFGYFLLFSATGAIQKIKYLAFLGTFLLAAMATLSRGGFIGLAAVGAYCWYCSPKKGNALVVLAIAVMFMVLFAPQTYWDEVSSSTSDETMSEEGTGGARLYTWGIGMDMFLHNPVIGVGQGNFQWTIGEYEAGRTFHTRSFAGRQAHSAWVTLASELGLLGIVTIGGLIVCAFLDLRLVRRKFSPRDVSYKPAQGVRQEEDVQVYIARAIEGSLIGFIFTGVFISVLWYPSLWIMLAFAGALRNIAENSSGSKSPSIMTCSQGTSVQSNLLCQKMAI